MDVEAKIQQLNAARGFYASFLATTPDEKLGWKPEGVPGDATSILEITRHCIAADVYFRALFESGTMPQPPDGAHWADSNVFASAGPAAGLETVAELAELMRKEGDATAEAMRAVPADKWGELLTVPWMTGPRELFADLLVSHWQYHLGQLAYIQRLYGDLSFG